jgi:formyl-CoA transferase
MQNVVGKFSRTPGAIDAPGPALGAHNREILVERLGFDESELAAAGIVLDPAEAPAPRTRAAGATP